MNDMTDQPAWATDSLPPAVQSHSGYVWTLDAENGTYWHNWLSPCTPTTLERQYGPCAPLWPETPTTSPLPDLSRWHPVPVGATIPEGMPYAHEQYGNGLPIVSTWDAPKLMNPGSTPRYTEHPIPAPDPDAHWIRAIAEATPETAPTVYAAIKGEQA